MQYLVKVLATISVKTVLRNLPLRIVSSSVLILTLLSKHQISYFAIDK